MQNEPASYIQNTNLQPQISTAHHATKILYPIVTIQMEECCHSNSYLLLVKKSRAQLPTYCRWRNSKLKLLPLKTNLYRCIVAYVNG